MPTKLKKLEECSTYVKKMKSTILNMDSDVVEKNYLEDLAEKLSENLRELLKDDQAIEDLSDNYMRCDHITKHTLPSLIKSSDIYFVYNVKTCETLDVCTDCFVKRGGEQNSKVALLLSEGETDCYIAE